jgi:hypothetical protein
LVFDAVPDTQGSLPVFARFSAALPPPAQEVFMSLSNDAYVICQVTGNKVCLARPKASKHYENVGLSYTVGKYSCIDVDSN